MKMKGKNKLEIVIFAIFLLFWVVQAEFRFCYKGPHRMTELDCPGGFFAKQKLNLTCKYFARTVNVSTTAAKFVGDVCDAGTNYEIDVLTTNEDDLSKLGDNLQQVIFDVNDDIMESDTGGKIDPEDICFASCLEEWVEPSAVDDEDFIDDGTDPTSITNTSQIMALELNKEIFLAIMDDGEGDEEDNSELDALLSQLGQSKRTLRKDPFTNDVDDGEHLRVLKLLAKSMRVTVAGCAPFIDEEFYRQVLKAFIYMSSKNESLIQDVSIEEYKTLNIGLNRCLQKRNLGFFLNGTICDGYPKVDGVYYFKSEEYWKYRLTGYSARWGRHNPFIEAGWNAIEFVHGYCFESFVDNIMDLHTYEMALEGLFTAMVLKHWQVPVTLKNDIFWNNVLNTKDIKQVMRNLDACVIGGTKMSPFTKRLERPYVGQDASENPKPVPPINPETSPSSNNDTKKGWTKGIEAYWEWYENRGGFKEIAKNFGFCINNEETENNKDEMDGYVQNFKETACPDAQAEANTGAANPAPAASPPPPSEPAPPPPAA